MFNIFLCRFFSTIIFIWATRINRVANNVTTGCTYNRFKDGDICKDCPAGYFGHNCSDMCSSPSYGIQCGQVCNCSICHHIFGCKKTTEIPEIGTATVKHKRSNELQSAKNTTHQKLQDVGQTTVTVKRTPSKESRIVNNTTHQMLQELL